MSLLARFAEQICGRGLTGEQQNFAIWHVLPDGDCQVDAAQAGHHDVGKQQVRRNGLRDLESGLSVVGDHGRKACLLEDHGQSVRDDCFIVYDEDYGLGQSWFVELYL